MADRTVQIALAEHAASALTVSRLTEDTLSRLFPGAEGETSRQLITAVLEARLSDTMRREINVARAIVDAAASIAPDETEKSPEVRTVDPDWLYRWRDAAGEASSEEVRRLWSRILARQVTGSGAFSLRTLEFLRVVSAEDARLIESLAPFVFGGDGRFVLRNIEFLASRGLAYKELLHLGSIGVLTGLEGAGLNYSLTHEPGGALETLRVGDRELSITPSSPSLVLVLPVFPLTAVAAEVMQLCDNPPDDEYLALFAAAIEQQGCATNVRDLTQGIASDTGTRNR